MAESTENLVALFKTDKDIPAGSYLALRDGQLYVWHKASEKKNESPKWRQEMDIDFREPPTP